MRLTPADSDSGMPRPPDGGDPTLDGGPDFDGGPDADLDAQADAEADADADAEIDAGCTAVCEVDHGTTDCTTGTCVVTCSTGWQDCDGDPLNGCETSISDQTSSCGACALMCVNANGSTVCDAGTCAPICNPGTHADCDDDVRNGCETPIDTASDCGGCGVTCTNAHGTTSCGAGACLPMCTPGYLDCDGNRNNGCETPAITDPRNCGVCGRTCSATQSCIDGACVNNPCPTGSGTGECDANPATYCETNTTNNLAHCGFCGNACSFPNASPQCTGSTCGIASCAGGFGNCDSTTGNGCETTLASSTAHCGRCANPCTNAHGTIACTGGACAPTCSVGWGSCDGNPQNGCETALTTTTHCGMCGRACTNSVPNATAACNAGVCQSVCNSFSGVYALKLTISTSWPTDGFIQSGSGNHIQHARLVLTQSGNSLTGTATPCGRQVPDFDNSVSSERYGIAFPDALWDRTLPAGNITITLGGLSVGSSVTSTRTAAPIGITLSDPVNGAWPSLSGVNATDHDGDGQRGVTLNYKTGGSYDNPPTAGTVFAPRATRAYLSERIAFSLGGSLNSCTQASGSATVPRIDSHTVGCRLESGSNCSSNQYEHLDSNAPNYSVRSTTYTLVRVGAPGASVSCASVRAAAP